MSYKDFNLNVKRSEIDLFKSHKTNPSVGVV